MSMEVITIESSAYDNLIDQITGLQSLFTTALTELKEASKPYLTTKEVCQMLNKSENWVLLNKADLGYSKRTGTLLFKRTLVEEYINEDFFQMPKTSTYKNY